MDDHLDDRHTEESTRAAFDRCREQLADPNGPASLPTLHVGDPAGCSESFTLRPEERADHALRADVVAALLDRSPVDGPRVWLTRAGGLGTEDVDAAWLAATRTASAEAGAPLGFTVVTPAGWVRHA